MHHFFKHILFVLVLTLSMSMQANGVDPVATKTEEATSKEENATVDYKEVEDVFMKIKRVDNILSPKKKLRKIKYTIA